MQKSTKMCLAVIMIALIALTALTLVACDGLFGSGKPDQEERLDFHAKDGILPYDVTKNNLSNHITVFYFDKTGNNRELTPSEYKIVDMTTGYDANVVVTISYNNLTATQVLNIAQVPRVEISFRSFTKPYEHPEVFQKSFTYKTESDVISDSALPTPTARNNNWKFLYWCYDQQLTQRFDGSLNNLATNGMMLYAKWDYIIQAGATQGLQYDYSSGTGVIVTGIGSATDKDIVIPTLYLDLPISEIGGNAFEDTDITSVTMPSVEAIEANAFSNCKELSNVTFSNNLHYIGERAFYGCSSLTEAVLPSEVNGFMPEAFSDCTQLTKFEFTPPDGTEGGYEDGSYIDGCPNLVTIAAPQVFLYHGSFNNVTDLTVTNGGVYSEFLQNFPALQTLTVGENVRYIGKIEDMPLTRINFNSINCNSFIDNFGVFSNFTNFPEFIVGDKVERIPDCMFYYCNNITSIELPASVKRVGVDAFAYSSLQYLTILSNSLSCEFHSFDHCSLVKLTAPISSSRQLGASVQKIEFTDGETLGDYTFGSSLTELILPDTLTSLGNTSFGYCNNSIFNIVDGVKYLGSKTNPKMALISVSEDVTSLQVSNQVKMIHSNAFSSGVNLNSVTVDSANDKFTTIDSLLYGNNHDLIFVPRKRSGSLTVPANTIQISKNAFKDCSLIKDVTLPASVTTIEDHAFDNCKLLSEINLPSSLTSLGSYAFYGCKSLFGIEIPSGITTIDSYTFYNCKSLCIFANPSGNIKSIGSYAFYGCAAIDSIHLTGITAMGSFAFSGCTSLTGISLSATMKSIGEYAFSGCSKLKSIKIPNGINIESYTFSGCTSLTNVILPTDASSIGAYAFKGCSSLESINIPLTVKSIGEKAFQDCESITSITLRATMKSVGDYCFSGCTNLESIRFEGTKTQYSSLINGTVFNRVAAEYVACNDGRIEF